MPKLTNQQKICRGLENSGFQKVESRTRKYITYHHPRYGWYFVGRSGALRANSKANSSSNSVSLTDSYAKHYIKLGETSHDG
jgi:hypothetical protein